MLDFNVIRYKYIAPITKIEVLQVYPTYQIVLYGHNLDSVTELKINDVFITNFIHVDKNQIIVPLPTELIGPINSVTAYSDSFTTHSADIEFRYTGTLRAGLERLVQTVLLTLFNTPGTDIFHKNAGGNLLSLFELDTKDTGTIISHVTAAVDATKKQIMEVQASQTDLVAEEKLVDLKVRTVDVDPTTGRVRVELTVTALAGSTSVAIIQ